MIFGEIQIIGHDVAARGVLVIEELEIINAAHIGIDPPVTGHTLAESEASGGLLLNIIDPSDVVDEFGHQVCDIRDGERRVFVQDIAQMLYGLAQEPVCDLVHVIGNAPRLIVGLGNGLHGHESHRAQRRDNRQLPCGERILRGEFVKAVVAIPVGTVVELVLSDHLVHEAADQARFRERLVVYGNDAYTAGFETFVKIDADGHAL